MSVEKQQTAVHDEVHGDETSLAHFDELASWYFDRLGKAERFQRHIYSLSVATDLFANTGLHIGIANVLEWPKVPNPTKRPPWRRDVTSVYMMPTRDGGKTFDLDWVYAGCPLISRGSCDAHGGNCAYDHGYIQPASEFVTVNDTHWLFYEARSQRHEHRWKKPATIAAATWPLHRFGSLRPGTPDTIGAFTQKGMNVSEVKCGVVVSKRFRLGESSLYLNAVVGHRSKIVVAILQADVDGVAFVGFGEDDAVPVGPNIDSLSVRVEWKYTSLISLVGARVQIFFRLCGDAHLFAFKVGA